MTVSTSGLVPMIKNLADEPLQIRLAISLHGATNEVRDVIMPINKRYNLEQLMEACIYFTSRRRQAITFEFILIANINDSIDQAEHLARLAGLLRAKVNLIPYNVVEGLPWERPGTSSQRRFLDVLKRRGIPVTLRLEKGHDIDAACGQLRLKAEREENAVSG